MVAGAPAADARRDTTAVVVLAVVALALRAWGANNGLWIDEIYSLLNSFRLPLAETLTQYPHDNHHPLYSALAHISLLTFGESPWAIRLPSIVFGAATVPLLYVLGRYLAGRREAMLAAALLAVSYHHVWFSQNARGYVMIAFFAIACTWLMLRLLDGGAWSLALWYAVCAALGAFTHLTMVFIVVGHAVAAVVILLLGPPADRRHHRAAVAVGAFALSGALTLILHAAMISDVIAHFTNRPSGLKGISTPAWALAEAVRMLAAGFGAGSVLLGAVVIVVAVALFGIGFVSYARRRPAALTMFVAPVAVIFLGAALARGTFYPRFLFALIGFGVLIGVRGVLETADWVERRVMRRASAPAGRIGTVVMGLAVVLSLTSVLRSSRVPKQDFVGAAEYVASHLGPGDRIVTAGAATVPLRDYLHVSVTEVATAAAVTEMRSNGALWLVYTFPRYLARSAPEVMTMIESSCRNPVVFRGTTGGGDVIVCRLERAA